MHQLWYGASGPRRRCSAQILSNRRLKRATETRTCLSGPLVRLKSSAVRNTAPLFQGLKLSSVSWRPCCRMP
jgi:hypothetical protein